MKIKPLKRCVILVVVLICSISFGQTKVKGIISDADNYPLPFCNVVFKGSIIGTTTDENGSFYLESDRNWNELEVSFIGFETKFVKLASKVSYGLKIVLREESESLKEVVIITGKQPKKNNPAIDILREIWKRKKANGLTNFKQYQYDKYQKLEFDLNTIDDKLKESTLFKGMDFIFENVDTSKVTGKTYLPIFLNESVFKVYGDNVKGKKKEKLIANQASGFNGNDYLLNYIDRFYKDYNIYDNHLQFFDKSFVSPLSKTGINNYNYALIDSSFIDSKWCYNIVYYPRRKNELTFKGDFWVNDTTFAVKKINMQVVKSANINWVKDIYVEQEFDLLNDSTFVLKRDYFLSDFSLNNKEKSKGVYGKKTTVYKNYVFNKPIKTDGFFDKKVYENGGESVFNKGKEYWDNNRPEKLNDDEKKVFKMLDTLQTVKKFQRLKKTLATLSSGYFEVKKINFDFGPIFSSVGFNDIEGVRLRLGGRTYRDANDLFRVEGYTAYGIKDKQFKYGFEAKWLVDRENRFTITAGNKKDIEQMGAILTNSLNLLGATRASSSILNTGTNDKLTNLNVSSITFGLEPIKNVSLNLSFNYKTLTSAAPNTFNLDYNDVNSSTGISSDLKQQETVFSIGYYPGRVMSGLGIHRNPTYAHYTRIFGQVIRSTKGIFNSDFDYTKVQFSLYKLWEVGGLGRLKTNLEFGQTFGNVPLVLLNVAPGNQTYSRLTNTFNLLDFYEFVTDKYISFHLEHNFNGRIMSRIPLLKKAKLRTIVGFKSFYGSISDGNKNLNNTLNNESNSLLKAPYLTPYYEYSVGIGNIFRVLRVDFNFRGNYIGNDYPNVRKFGITTGVVFNF